jgi:hypothetical protein
MEQVDLDWKENSKIVLHCPKVAANLVVNNEIKKSIHPME